MESTATAENYFSNASTETSPRQVITSLVSELSLAQEGSSVNNSNPLASADDSIKHILLTLYAAFPNELLSALDLLDRRLVYCFRLLEKTIAQDVETKQEASYRSERSGLDGPNIDRQTNVDTRQDSLQARDVSSLVDAQVEAVSAGAEMPTNYINRDSKPRLQTEQEDRGELVPGLYYVRSGQSRSQPKARWREENPAHYEIRLTSWFCSCPAFSFSAFPPATPSTRRTSDNESRDKDSFGGISRGNDMPLCKHLLACYLADRCPQFRQSVEEQSVSMEEIAGWAAGWGD